MNEPLVSIIIPTFNRAHLIKETLDSVLAQSYSNWECIIVDDGSTDDTFQIVKKYIQKDLRFYYFKRPEYYKAGGNGARNFGIEASKGNYLQFLDSDDLLSENKIKSQIEILLQNQSDYNLISCKWEKFSNTSNEIQFNIRDDYRSFDSPKSYFDLIGKVGGFYPPHCFLTNRKIIKRAGFWNENIIKSQDAEFFFRVISNSQKILFDKQSYVLYRGSSNQNVSSLNTVEKAKSFINSWRIIEALYVANFPEDTKKLYINKKKNDVYNEINNYFPQLIKSNSDFFSSQIKQNNVFKKAKKLYKKITRRLLS